MKKIQFFGIPHVMRRMIWIKRKEIKKVAQKNKKGRLSSGKERKRRLTTKAEERWFQKRVHRWELDLEYDKFVEFMSKEVKIRMKERKGKEKKEERKERKRRKGKRSYQAIQEGGRRNGKKKRVRGRRNGGRRNGKKKRVRKMEGKRREMKRKRFKHGICPATEEKEGKVEKIFALTIYTLNHVPFLTTEKSVLLMTK